MSAYCPDCKMQVEVEKEENVYGDLKSSTTSCSECKTVLYFDESGPMPDHLLKGFMLSKKGLIGCRTWSLGMNNQTPKQKIRLLAEKVIGLGNDTGTCIVLNPEPTYLCHEINRWVDWNPFKKENLWQMMECVEKYCGNKYRLDTIKRGNRCYQSILTLSDGKTEFRSSPFCSSRTESIYHTLTCAVDGVS